MESKHNKNKDLKETRLCGKRLLIKKPSNERPFAPSRFQYFTVIHSKPLPVFYRHLPLILPGAEDTGTKDWCLACYLRH